MIRIIKENIENKIEQPKIIGADLIDFSDYLELEDNIPLIDDEDWWISNTDYVFEDEVISSTKGCSRQSHGVRPVLHIQLLNSAYLPVKTKFKFDDFVFTIISENLAICDECVGDCCYYNNYHPSDPFNYEKSDVKKYINRWFNKAKKKETDFFNKKNIDFMLQNNDNPELKAQLLQINHDLGYDNRADQLQKEIDDLFGDLEEE